MENEFHYSSPQVLVQSDNEITEDAEPTIGRFGDETCTESFDQSSSLRGHGPATD